MFVMGVCPAASGTDVNGSERQFRLYLDSIKHFSVAEQFTKADEFQIKAAELLPYISTDTLLFDYYIRSGMLHFDMNKHESAIHYCNLALAKATQLGEEKKMLVSYSTLANAHASAGNYHVSLLQQKKALSLVDAADSASYYSILQNMAVTYSSVGKPDSSLALYIKANKYFERTGQLIQQAICTGNIGELYRTELNDYDLAIKHFRKSIDLAKEAKASAALSRSYGNLALTFLHKGQLDSSQVYIAKAKELKMAAGDVGGMANMYYALGNLSLDEGNLDNAILNYSNATAICKEHGIDIGLYHTGLALAATHKQLGNYKIAYDNLQAALSLAENKGWANERLVAIDNLYRLHKDFRRWPESLATLEAYNTLRDSLEASEQLSALAEIKTRYETELTLKENEALLSQNELKDEKISLQRVLMIGLIVAILALIAIGLGLLRAIRQRNVALRIIEKGQKDLQEQLDLVQEQKAKLTEAYEFKNRVISVIGHDLRAPLNSIIGILELARDTLKESGVGYEMLERLEGEANANLKTLQNMVEWSRNEIQNLTPVRIWFNPKEVIGEAVALHQTQLELKNIKMSIECTEQLYADENQFRSIVTNLLNNAIKYSPKGGEISVMLSESDEGYEFFVRDEGVGVEEDVMDKIEKSQTIRSKSGTMGERGTGLGLRLVSDFAKAHGGLFTLRNNDGSGTQARVTLPKVSRVVEALA